MATYTIELRHVCDLYGRDEVEGWFKAYNIDEYLTKEQQDTIAKHGLWSKDRLAKKIVDHYWMREIGFETPALFKHQAEVMMNELMETELPMIYSCAIEYDPLINVDFTETYSQTRAGQGKASGTSSSTDNGSGLSVNSDTPQGQISKDEILKGKYASSTSANESTGSSSAKNDSTSESNEQTEYTRRTRGNSGVTATAQAMVRQYRNVVKAVDKEIIDSLHPLFMGVF